MCCLISPMYSLSVKLLCGMPAHNVFLSLPSRPSSAMLLGISFIVSLHLRILVVELTIFHADCSLRFLTCDSFKWPPFVSHAAARLLTLPNSASLSSLTMLFVSVLGDFARNIMLLI